MSKKINIRPTSGVYATYKRLSYEPWSALAEFIDNSTQSFYDHKEELLSIKYSKGLQIEIEYVVDSINGDRIEILDNAYGMEWKDFQRAVTLDNPPNNTQGRNEFGMGLKTAACWFGTFWSIESTQLNSKMKYYTELNVATLGKYKNEEIDVKEETVSLKDHYTKIIIRNLNQKITAPRTIGKVKDHLANIYRQDLRSGFVSIFYNGVKLNFKEVQVYREKDGLGNEMEWKKDVNFTIKHNGKDLNVNGFIAIRIPGSLKDAGFTLLRRGRVILGGSECNYRPFELFGNSNSYSYQRMFGELNMDNWPVTQAKDNFDWHNSGLEEAFIDELSKHTAEYRKKAEEIRIREIISTETVMKKAIDDLSNSGLVQNVKITSNQSEIDIETTNKSIVIPELIDHHNDGVLLSGSESAEIAFTYKNISYNFIIKFNIDNPAAHWLLVEKIDNYEYILFLNIKHSFFKPMIENKEFMPVMMKLSVALVLAEIETTMLSPDGKINGADIRLKMNEILDIVRGEEIGKC